MASWLVDSLAISDVLYSLYLLYTDWWKKSWTTRYHLQRTNGYFAKLYWSCWCLLVPQQPQIKWGGSSVDIRSKGNRTTMVRVQVITRHLGPIKTLLWKLHCFHHYFYHRISWSLATPLLLTSLIMWSLCFPGPCLIALPWLQPLVSAIEGRGDGWMVKDVGGGKIYKEKGCMWWKRFFWELHLKD